MTYPVTYDSDEILIKGKKAVVLNKNSGYGFFAETGCSRLRSTRFCVAYMCSWGLFLAFSSRIILSVAIVDMVTKRMETENQDTINKNCPVPSQFNSSTAIYDSEEPFDWSIRDQGKILGAFFYGFFFSQLPAAILGAKLGGKISFAISIVGTGACTAAVPLVSFLGPDALIILRFLMGVLQGSLNSASRQLMGLWAPEFERSLLSTITQAGGYLGNVIAPPVVGYLCTIDLIDGWPLAFILLGVLTIIWFAVWIFAVTDSPDSHPNISTEERYFIQLSSASMSNNRPIPWNAMMRSKPLLALLVAQFCSNWMNLGIMLVFSQYLAHVLNYSISANGLISAMPWLCSFVSMFIFSEISDSIRKRSLYSTTTVRKANQAIGSILPCVFLVLAGFADCNDVLILTCFLLAMTFYGAVFSGYSCNSLDLSPNHAGIIYAICNTLAVTPGFLLSFVVEYFTRDNIHSPMLWRQVFYFLGGLGLIGGLVFIAWGSGEKQDWDGYEAIPDKIEDEKRKHCI